MTQREQQILTILKSEPTISQNDLAKRLGITRSSVAVHITNLLKKGLILGKGYIVSEEPYIVVLGGANIDIQGFPSQPLIANDSNIGTVKVSLGGVGRNIAENCARLNIPTRLISVIGNDLYGQQILKQAQMINLNMQDSLVLSNEPTSTYLSILDSNRELAVAINHMESINQLSIDFIKSKQAIIQHAKLIVLDTNIPQAVIDYIFTHFSKIPIFVDTVSISKAKKIKPHLKAIHTLKPNLAEAIALSDLNDKQSLTEVGFSLKAKRVFISQGRDGVLAIDGKKQQHFPSHPTKVVNATGAGDAFMAGLIYSYLNGYDLSKTVRVAQSAAIITLTHQDTISPLLTEETLHKMAKEINND